MSSGGPSGGGAKFDPGICGNGSATHDVAAPAADEAINENEIAMTAASRR